MLDHAVATHLPIANRWRTHKRLMVEAARLARDDWVSRAAGEIGKTSHSDGQVTAARSISQ
eukprot:8585676-Pyramimonas_sp.AAC.1